MNDLIGHCILWNTIEEDRSVWFDGPLSFAYHLGSKHYYFHWFNFMNLDKRWPSNNVIDIWLIKQMTWWEMNDFFANRVDFHTVLEDASVGYARNNVVIKIKAMSDKYRLGIPNPGIYWSNEHHSFR